jgi:hypothetical protein
MTTRTWIGPALAAAVLAATSASADMPQGSEPPQPEIASISPSEGPPGTEVTIKGTYWSPITLVLVGGVEARIESATGNEVVAVVGPHRPGRVSVEVRDSRGRSGVQGWGFRYLPPPENPP